MTLIFRLIRMIVLVAFTDRGQELRILPDHHLSRVDTKLRQDDCLTILIVELSGRNFERTAQLSM